MEVLVNKLAELLQVGVDGATKAYPVLRGQFIWYQALDYLMEMASMVSVVGFILSVIAGIFFTIACDGRYPDGTKRVVKVIALVLISSTVIYVVAGIVRVIMAPDIMMILKLV